MSERSRNVFGSCLTIGITIVIVLGLLILAGMGVAVFSLLAGA